MGQDMDRHKPLAFKLSGAFSPLMSLMMWSMEASLWVIVWKERCETVSTKVLQGLATPSRPVADPVTHWEPEVPQAAKAIMLTLMGCAHAVAEVDARLK
jgi:hypothetical protein